MPATMTIHGLDAPVAERLGLYARQRNQSLNQAMKELLASSLGISPRKPEKPENGLGRLRGSIPPEIARELSDFVKNADFSKVEAGDAP